MGSYDGVAQLFPLWDLWMLWPDLHSESFAGIAWDVTLQSSCKITVINVGSFTVPQKQPALLKLDIAKPSSAGEWWGACQNSGLSVTPVLLLPGVPAARHPPCRVRAAEHHIPQQLCSGRELLGASREEQALNTVPRAGV